MPPEGPFKIGAATLDPARGTLSVDGDLVPIRSKSFSLLCHMARNAGRVVTKDEIFAVIWPDVIVTEDSLTQCVRDARKAIRDETQDVLRTVPRRGYILVAQEPLTFDEQATPQKTDPLPAGPAEPVVVVLPFGVALPDGGRNLHLRSFNEELADAISRFRSVAVIAPASARIFGPDDDIVEAGLTLKADYCVGGTISEGYELQLRVNLVDVASGRRIWTDTVTISREQLLATPGTIAARIVGRLVGSVESDAARRAQRAPTASFKAYAHLMKGIALLRQHGEGFNEAGKVELEAAERLDAESGLIQSYLALAEAMIARAQGGNAASFEGARARAVRATALAPDEARCHRVLAIVLSYMQEFAAAESQYRRAVQLNPYDADTLAQLGFMRATRGYPDEALELMDRAVQLNPFHPDWYHADRHTPLFMVRRFGEAAESMERLPQLSARQLAYVAACYALDDQPDKAARYLAQAFRRDAKLDIEAAELIIWEKPHHRAMLLDGLRKAARMMDDEQARRS